MSDGADRGVEEGHREQRRRIVVAVASGLLALVAVTVPLVVFLVGQRSSASFADSEVLVANQLGAAVFDIDVDGSPGAGPSSGDESSSGAAEDADTVEALFTATNLAPGDRVSGQLEVTNAGELSLRYGLDAIGDGGPLEPWLRFEVWAGTGACSPDQPGPSAVEDVMLGDRPAALVELYSVDQANILDPGESAVWCIGATLPLATPNEAQGQRLDLTLVVTAEQVVEEAP